MADGNCRFSLVTLMDAVNLVLFHLAGMWAHVSQELGEGEYTPGWSSVPDSWQVYRGVGPSICKVYVSSGRSSVLKKPAGWSVK